MTGKRLTLKQLYGYSIMNWERYLYGLEELDRKRDCSFCIESNDTCEKCKIEPKICNFHLFNCTLSFFVNTSEIHYKSTTRIIRRLKREYYKL